MRRSFLHAFFILVLAVAGLGAKGCDNDLLSDPTFRDWCGESLCSWTVESGSVARVPTWNEDDFGVSFVATPTTISQSIPDVPKCIDFTALADVDPSAELTLGLDFNRDGSIDWEAPLFATGFAQAKLAITAPYFYDGIRFVVTKKGGGKAVLAQLRAQSGSDCTAPPVALSPQPLGTPCAAVDDGATCASGVCCEGLCSDCCLGGQAGQLLPDGGVALDAPKACPSGGTCARQANGIRGFFQSSVPLECDPGAGKKPAGAECLDGADCASGTCDGATASATSLDPVGDAGTACDVSFPDAGGCNITQVRGGVCK